MTNMNVLRTKPCQSNLISFFDWVTGLADKEEAIDVIYLDVIKTSDIFSCHISLNEDNKFCVKLLQDESISGSKTTFKE